MVAKDLVLIVEDDPLWQDKLKLLLKEEGFVSETASNYLSAIRYLQSLKPGALVLDMQLGQEDYREDDWEGWSLAQKAREQGIASIIVTGHARASISSRAFREFGVVDFFDKIEFVDHNRAFVQRVVEALETTRRWQLELTQKISTPERRDVVQVQFDEIANSKFILQAIKSPLGELRTLFKPPFPKTVLQHFLNIVQERRTDFSRLSPKEADLLETYGVTAKEKAEKDLLEQVGMRLYEAIATEKMGTALTMMANCATNTDTSATLQVRFDEQAVELAQYPWELLHDGYSFLARDYGISLTRYIICPIPVPRMQLSFPLRVLMIIARPFGVPQLRDVEEEAIRSVIEEADLSDKYEFSRLESPVTYERVMRVLEDARRQGNPFDVIYYDGHGDYGWKCRNCDEVNGPKDTHCTTGCGGVHGKHEGFIFFEGESKNKVAIGASDLIKALRDSGVQIAALSACNTAKVAGQTLFNSVGPELGRIVPAIIAMQFPIPTSDALAFFKEFFKTLGTSESVDAFAIEKAVKNARKYIPTDGWFYPVLYLRVQ